MEGASCARALKCESACLDQIVAETKPALAGNGCCPVFLSSVCSAGVRVQVPMMLLGVATCEALSGRAAACGFFFSRVLSPKRNRFSEELLRCQSP